ncbi:hypothetical protein LCGC14_2034070 [marine sediment metagenome]|uniref:Uncharacterized protein n=1 Tax=marine sediment metagenome TaxID=412755 RepID=A0A0F9FGE3_9ZZZZ
MDLLTQKHDRDAILLRYPADELGKAIVRDLEVALVECEAQEQRYQRLLTLVYGATNYWNRTLALTPIEEGIDALAEFVREVP